MRSKFFLVLRFYGYYHFSYFFLAKIKYDKCLHACLRESNDMVIRQIIYLRTNVSAIFVTDGNERA